MENLYQHFRENEKQFIDQVLDWLHQVESHYATKGTAKKTNSVFNVGAYDGHSARKQIKNGFGYDNPNDSIEPYLILITSNYLVNGKTVYDYISLPTDSQDENPTVYYITCIIIRLFVFSSSLRSSDCFSRVVTTSKPRFSSCSFSNRWSFHMVSPSKYPFTTGLGL